MTRNDIIQKANKHLGEKYILGSLAPKNNPDYKGPWDCAEFVSWVIYQVTGKLYGCADNQSQHPASADAGTIY
jgi:N-acetylmuramoyl-L-alanine amidase